MWAQEFTGDLPNDFTGGIAAAVASRRFESLPEDVRRLARQCVLDCLGVAIAGASEPLVGILAEEARAEGSGDACSLIGRGDRASLYQAALVNGSAAHALDYDDVNMTMIAHASAAILPGLLALAEARGASGADLLTAFVAGYEAGGEIGRYVATGHYNLGFHCTATLGTFGAAGACARLLGLDRDRTATALGIAGTQAAGLKSMFGTMCKPFHAGKASQNGVLAASLAKRGFTSRPDVLEAPQGFIATQCPELRQDGGRPAGDFHLRRNLFKYHAACYNTHAAIEAARVITGGKPMAADAIDRVVVRVDRAMDKVCNIAAPRDGLEAKFSLRLTTAFALAGVDTARLDTYCEANATDPRLVALRDKVQVELVSFPQTTIVELELVDRHGARARARHDSGIAETDIVKQDKRLREKFHSLVDPIFGEAPANRLIELIDGLEALPSAAVLARAASVAAPGAGR